MKLGRHHSSTAQQQAGQGLRSPVRPAAPSSAGPVISSTWQHARGHSLVQAALPGQGAALRTNAAQTETVATSAATPFGQLDFGSSTVQGVRDTMEDEVQVHFNEDGQYLYAAVFDGHGGDAAAQWLSKELHVQVHCSLTGTCLSDEACGTGVQRPSQISQLMIDSFLAADKQLLAYLEGPGGEPTVQAGSTATIAVVKDGRLVVANVGDSQAVLSRKGNAVAIAHQHRVYGSGPDVEAETQRVKATGGWVDDGRVCGVLAVSRAFGDWEFKGSGLSRLLQSGIERGFWDQTFAAQQSFSADPVVATPDVTETVLSADDEFLIVASDGLWDVMPPREAVTWARKEFKAKKSAEDVARSLTDLALKRYSTDNVGVIVVDLLGAEHWGAKPAKAKKKPLLGFFRS